MESETLKTIAKFAGEAAADTDQAILHSGLPNDNPTLVALKLAQSALQKIQLTAEVEDTPPLDAGML